MVKADAYGHGLIPISEFALKELNIKEFGVATLFEAVALRRFFPHLKFEIYVFSELLLDDGRQISNYLDYRLIPVISSKDDLKQMFKKRFSPYTPLSQVRYRHEPARHTLPGCR